MHIASFRVKNFKCFRDTGEVDLDRGFNVITGKNNSGKTALAQCLSLTIENKPHRSLITKPTESYPLSDPSRVELRLALTSDEFVEIALHLGSKFLLPRNPNAPVDEQVASLMDAFSSGHLSISLEYQESGFVSAYLDTQYTSLQSSQALRFNFVDEDHGLELDHGQVGSDMTSTLPYKIAPLLRQNIYHFKAERFNVARHQIGPDPTLRPDASNLAQTLNHLQTSNPDKYSRLIRHIREIFPDIQYVTTPPHGGGVAHISLWPLDTSTERADLALPLHESGTGVGQVLAILYVAISSVSPRPIVIDEPQSFLHPGAIRKLLGILESEYPHHQYILTTHSPLVISTISSPFIIQLIKSDAESLAQPVDPSDSGALADLLSDVGARLSDVFGADNILWVEGTTEERCFPLIVQQSLNRSLLGTAIVGILNVGDFEGKHAETVASIYNRLSAGVALLPPAVAFIFDREDRSQQDLEDIKRHTGGKARFIPRRMYENYLLNPDAIESVISTLPNFSQTAVTTQIIRDWITSRGCQPEFISPQVDPSDPFSVEWLTEVLGDKLLNSIFKSLSENRYEYDKTTYGVQLTKYILENEPEGFEDIESLLQEILDEAGSIGAY